MIAASIFKANCLRLKVLLGNKVPGKHFGFPSRMERFSSLKDSLTAQIPELRAGAGLCDYARGEGGRKGRIMF